MGVSRHVGRFRLMFTDPVSPLNVKCGVARVNMGCDAVKTRSGTCPER